MQSARAGACRLEIFHSGADAGAAQLPCRHQTRWASSDLLQHECRLRQRRVAPWQACLGAAPLSGAWRKCRQLLTPQSAIALLSASFRARKASQRLDRHGNDVRGLPRRRDLDGTKAESEGLRQDCTDDRYDSPLAVQHRGSRSTMIEHQTIIAFINFHQCRTRELLVVAIGHKPTAGKAKMTLWISECNDALFR